MNQDIIVVYGIILVVLTATQFFGQVVKSFRTKSTRDLSWWTFIQIFIISILWTIYGVWNGLPEVIVTNTLANIVCDAILVRKYLSEKR